MHPINQQLLDDGWREYPDHLGERKRLLFCKSFDGHAECKCNEGKRKQVEIYHYPADRINGYVLRESWRVDCVGQLPDNEWLRMNVEGLTDIDTINRTLNQLLKIWDYAVSITPTIEKPNQ
jgi:hypothetical protein